MHEIALDPPPPFKETKGARLTPITFIQSSFSEFSLFYAVLQNSINSRIMLKKLPFYSC